jgi:hypothetical protein
MLHGVDLFNLYFYSGLLARAGVSLQFLVSFKEVLVPPVASLPEENGPP